MIKLTNVLAYVTWKYEDHGMGHEINHVNETVIWVNPNHIITIESSGTNHVATAQSELIIGFGDTSKSIVVKETPEQVMNLIDGI